jgi:hypothetical protein
MYGVIPIVAYGVIPNPRFLRVRNLLFSSLFS